MESIPKNWHPWPIDQKHFMSEVVTEFLADESNGEGIAEGYHNHRYQAAAFFDVPWSQNDSLLVNFSWHFGDHVVLLQCESERLLEHLAAVYKKWVEDGDDGNLGEYPYHAVTQLERKDIISELYVSFYKEYEE